MMRERKHVGTERHWREKADFRHNISLYGFGPVVIPGVYDGHNKTFFFFFVDTSISAQAVRTLTLSSVPTALERSGDFSRRPSTETCIDVYPWVPQVFKCQPRTLAERTGLIGGTAAMFLLS